MRRDVTRLNPPLPVNVTVGEKGGDAAEGLAVAVACSGDPTDVVTLALCESGPPSEPCEASSP